MRLSTKVQRLMLVVVVLPAVLGCAGGSRAAQGSTASRSIITRDQILEHRFTTAYDAVQALRANWLNARGTDSFTAPGEVQVYLDNTHLGGMATLKGIATTPIVSIRFISGIDATARWGLGHGHGVVFVSTTP